jgi:catechol 2,3-dioxygenase-like lactoylglutathione lyase family enzyme
MSEATSIVPSGVHHMALVCRDMEVTVDFYTKILGMPLVKGFDIPGGQHFFFDMGGNNLLAFFWFSDAPDAAPGVASANHLLGTGSISSAHGSMNHVAFHAPLENIEAIREELIGKGVDVSEIVNHADISTQPGIKRTTDGVEEETWLRSIYFLDPDGVMLEYCAAVKDGTGDVSLPVNAEGIKADGRGLDGD